MSSKKFPRSKENMRNAGRNPAHQKKTKPKGVEFYPHIFDIYIWDYQHTGYIIHNKHIDMVIGSPNIISNRSINPATILTTIIIAINVSRKLISGSDPKRGRKSETPLC